MTADYALRNYSGNAVKTNLTTGMTNSDTTTTLAASTGWPSSAFWMVIDLGQTTEELVYVGARSGLNLSGIIRNITGGGAFSHSAGGVNTVAHVGSYQDFVEANAVAAALTTKGDSLWKGGTASVAPARLAAGTDQQIVRYLAANTLGVETTHKGSIPIFASTGARDTAIPSPASGQVCYVDSGDLAEGFSVHNGTSWRLPWNLPWGVIDVKTVTASQTGISTTADITGMSSTFTAVSGRRYRYTLMLPVTVQQTSTGIQTALITDGSNVVKGSTNNTVTAASQAFSVVIAFESPAAGSTTRKGRMATTAGTVDLSFSSSLVGSFCVEDVGPSGNPT